MRKLYLVMAVLGTLLPCRYFIRFLMEYGLDVAPLFWYRQPNQSRMSAV